MPEKSFLPLQSDTHKRNGQWGWCNKRGTLHVCFGKQLAEKKPLFLCLFLLESNKTYTIHIRHHSIHHTNLSSFFQFGMCQSRDICNLFRSFVKTIFMIWVSHMAYKLESYCQCTSKFCHNRRSDDITYISIFSWHNMTWCFNQISNWFFPTKAKKMSHEG